MKYYQILRSGNYMTDMENKVFGRVVVEVVAWMIFSLTFSINFLSIFGAYAKVHPKKPRKGTAFFLPTQIFWKLFTLFRFPKFILLSQLCKIAKSTWKKWINHLSLSYKLPKRNGGIIKLSQYMNPNNHIGILLPIPTSMLSAMI